MFENQLKIWSSHLLDNLSNCLMNLKNSGDSTGFEPMTSAMPVQCSNQLSYEVTQLRAGQFVGLMFSRERNVVWKKYYMKCGVWKSTEDMILALAGQFKQLSHEPEKFRWLNGIRTHDLFFYSIIAFSLLFPKSGRSYCKNVPKIQPHLPP